MRTEFPRQLVHLSGLVLVLLSLYAGKWLAALYMLGFALFFLAYYLFIRSGIRPWGFIDTLERGFRRLVLRFERRRRPSLSGPIWFYIGLFLAYLAFPLRVAFLAGIVLSVGDSLATLVGKPLGRHAVLPGKSLEGSVAFLAGSFLVCLLFAPPLYALAASLGGLLGEMLPALPCLRDRPWIDDNLTIPLVSALGIMLLMLLV